MTDGRESADDGEGSWTELLEDAAAIADEYRNRGWTVVAADTRDVVPWTATDGGNDAGKPAGGFTALLPDAAFDELETLVERDGAAFDAAEVYRRSVGDAVLAIAVELDAATDAAVVLPLYYRPDEASDALATALDRGELLVRVRSVSRDEWVTFAHDDPALFVADEE